MTAYEFFKLVIDRSEWKQNGYKCLLVQGRNTDIHHFWVKDRRFAISVDYSPNDERLACRWKSEPPTKSEEVMIRLIA